MDPDLYEACRGPAIGSDPRDELDEATVQELRCNTTVLLLEGDGKYSLRRGRVTNLAKILHMGAETYSVQEETKEEEESSSEASECDWSPPAEPGPKEGAAAGKLVSQWQHRLTDAKRLKAEKQSLDDLEHGCPHR